MQLMNHGGSDQRKSTDPQFEHHAEIKNGAGSGISHVHLYTMQCMHTIIFCTIVPLTVYLATLK